jgi:hypothetical protein
MLALTLLLAQAAAPDLQLSARVQAREVTIERKGSARLEVRASPDAGSKVESNAPAAGDGRRLRNVDVRVDAEARIGGATAPQERR